jgi:hypothetical protein
MKISPYTIYLEMQPDALLVRQNFIICKKWMLHVRGVLVGFSPVGCTLIRITATLGYE